MSRSPYYRCRAIAGLSVFVFIVSVRLAQASPYAVAYTDGGTWNTVYAQGFNTSLGANPVPPSNVGDPAYLNQFQFYKSGNADTASNIQLAIFNTMYPNTVGLTTASSNFVGLSTNTISSTAPISTGNPITFSFNSLPLTYGSDYSAVFVNVGAGGSLTPVLVSALTANYAQQPDNNYHPVTNYGTETQFNYTTSNFISNGFFQAFSYAGDADFTASLDTAVPEPSSLMLSLGALFGLIALRVRRPLRKS